jgi:hypothetical protein
MKCLNFMVTKLSRSNMFYEPILQILNIFLHILFLLSLRLVHNYIDLIYIYKEHEMCFLTFTTLTTFLARETSVKTYIRTLINHIRNNHWTWVRKL